MNNLLTRCTAAILAQDVETLSSLRRGWEQRSTTGDHGWLWWVAGLVGAIIVLAAVKNLLARAKSGRAKSALSRLGEAARVLGLSGPERADVERVAQRARLPEPVAMLLSPANLAHAYARGFAETGEEQNTGLRRRLDALSTRLFGQPLPAVGEPVRTSSDAE